MNAPVRVILALGPVFLFLAGLVFLDSFKLVSRRAVLRTILVGCGVAVAALVLNRWVMHLPEMNPDSYSKYVAPIAEEILKSVYPVYLIQRKRVGFMVDAAICGFAVGAGFAFVENIYYLRSLQDPGLLLWLIRGFGTAIMHGGTTAIFAMLWKTLTERYPARDWLVLVPALGTGVAIHGFFNQFLFPPVINSVMQLAALPVLVAITFNRSERALRGWLEVGLDTDVELLGCITTGTVSGTKVGRYLDSLVTMFPGPVVADMLCLLRIHIELAIQAKGMLLMREAGFAVGCDPATKERLTELKFLEASIGKTGRLAIAPILRTSSRDLWQLCLVGKK